jgi:hypothetical protein
MVSLPHLCLCDFWGSAAFQLWMPSAETAERAETVERASPRDAAHPEERAPQRDGLIGALIVGVGGLLTVAWFCLLVLLVLWFIRAVL